MSEFAEKISTQLDEQYGELDNKIDINQDGNPKEQNLETIQNKTSFLQEFVGKNANDRALRLQAVSKALQEVASDNEEVSAFDIGVEVFGDQIQEFIGALGKDFTYADIKGNSAEAHTNVKSIQSILALFGQDLGSYGVDGSYGKTPKTIELGKEHIEGESNTRNAVRKLQAFLIEKECLANVDANLDGRFGDGTLNALKKFLEEREGGGIKEGGREGGTPVASQHEEPLNLRISTGNKLVLQDINQHKEIRTLGDGAKYTARSGIEYRRHRDSLFYKGNKEVWQKANAGKAKMPQEERRQDEINNAKALFQKWIAQVDGVFGDPTEILEKARIGVPPESDWSPKPFYSFYLLAEKLHEQLNNSIADGEISAQAARESGIIDNIILLYKSARRKDLSHNATIREGKRQAWRSHSFDYHPNEKIVSLVKMRNPESVKESKSLPSPTSPNNPVDQSRIALLPDIEDAQRLFQKWTKEVDTRLSYEEAEREKSEDEDKHKFMKYYELALSLHQKLTSAISNNEISAEAARESGIINKIIKIYVSAIKLDEYKEENMKRWGPAPWNKTYYEPSNKITQLQTIGQPASEAL